MKTHTRTVLILLALLCLIPATKELFKVLKDFNGTQRIVENKTDQSPHDQLKKLLLEKYTQNYIKLSPIVDYKEFPKSTLNVELSDKLDKLLNPWIEKINKDQEQNYYLMDYENVIQQKDTNGNVQYLADVFIHDKDLHIIQKIIFDVIVYVDGRVWLNKIVHSNAKEPLEHVDNYKDTHGVNTNQIIKNSNVNKPVKVSGNPGIGLDYSKVEFKNGLEKKRLTVEDVNSWVLPKKIQEMKDSGVESWPCGTSSDSWDKWGVLKNKVPKYPCQGYNQAATKRPIQVYDNPTIGETPRGESDYHDYFALETAIPSFP